MPLTLVTTAPDGAVTRNNPVMHGPAVMLAVSHTLRAAGLGRREADRVGQTVVNHPGRDWVHTLTGHRFHLEITS